jgi:hypothetical protein
MSLECRSMGVMTSHTPNLAELLARDLAAWHLAQAAIAKAKGGSS